MWRFPLVALVLWAGCGHNIGDSCNTNVDCSPLGDRFCDVSSLNGYCTIENCTIDSCPGDSVCVRFFSPVQDEPCSFDPSQPFSRADCMHEDDRCICDRDDDHGNCIGNGGHCAPASTEHRWCEARCSSNSDCRTGYECRQTGSFGAEPVPSFDLGAGEPAKYCAPTGSSS